MPMLDPDRQAVNEEFNTIVGCNIRQFRTRYAVTMSALAEAAGMDVTVLMRIEQGDRSIKFRDAVEVAKRLTIPLDALYKKQRSFTY